MSMLAQLTEISTWIFGLDALTVPRHDFDELRRRLGTKDGDDILTVVNEIQLKPKKDFERSFLNGSGKMLPTPNVPWGHSAPYFMNEVARWRF